VVNYRLRSLYLQEVTPAPIKQEALWAPEPVWLSWKGEKSLALAGMRNALKRTEGNCPKSVSKQQKLIICATAIYYLFIFYFKALSVTLIIARCWDE
jgi:hypothetical protein